MSQALHNDMNSLQCDYQYNQLLMIISNIFQTKESGCSCEVNVTLNNVLIRQQH